MPRVREAVLLANGHPLRGRNLGALWFSHQVRQPAFKESRYRQIVRVLAIPCEGHRLSDTSAGRIGVTKGPRAEACAPNRTDGGAGNLLETSRLKASAQTCEIILNCDEVTATKTRIHLSTVCKS